MAKKLDEVKAAKAAEQAVADAKIKNNFFKDGGLIPDPRTLTDIQARDWYNSRIDYIDSAEAYMRSQGASSKDIFELTTNLRNELKTQAREFMENQELAKSLPSPKTADELLKKYNGNYEAAISASRRTITIVNESIKLRRLNGEK